MNEDSISHPDWLNEIASSLGPRPYATIFGSSIRGAGDLEIEQWIGVSERLADSGWGLLSGGYQGTMSLLSSRHIEAGGHAVGITCSTVVDEITPGSYSQIMTVDSPFKRLEALLRLGKVYFVLPGGIGTLVELTCAIWLQDRDLLAEVPVLLLGSAWGKALEWFTEVPGNLRGRRTLPQMVTNILTYEQFEREWALIEGRLRL